MLILAEICAKPAAAAEASRNVLHLGEENTMAACVLRIEDFDDDYDDEEDEEPPVV